MRWLLSIGVVPCAMVVCACVQEFVSFESTIWGEVAQALAADGAIAVNINDNFAFSDGLASGENEALTKGVGAAISQRIVRAPMLAMDFIALRVRIHATAHSGLLLHAM